MLDHPRTGRPSKTYAAEERPIEAIHLKDRFKIAADTARNCRVNEQNPRNSHTKAFKSGVKVRATS